MNYEGKPDARRFWNQKTLRLQPYTPGEQPRGQRFIKLNTNENPYPPSPAVAEALKNYDPDRLRLYPDPTGLVFRQAIAEYYELSVDQVFAGNGSDEVLAMAFQAFFESGPKSASPRDESDPACISADPSQMIVFPDVTYSFYPVFARMYDIPCRTIMLNEDFTLPMEACKAPSAGLVLANPNAPTGMAITQRELSELADSDPDRLILVDEAYVDFGAESAVPLLAGHDNLLVIQTCSKSRSLAGMRLGFAIGAPPLITALEHIRDSFNSYTLDSLAQAAGAAAFHAGAWFEETRAKIIRTRTRMAAGLRQMGFDVLPSSANFLLVRHPAWSGQALYEQLRQSGILVRHFSLPRITDYLRITVGTDEDVDNLFHVLDRMLMSCHT